MQENTLSPELMSILVCPENRMPVRPAPQDLIDKVNTMIEQGSIRTMSGRIVEKKITAGLIREDLTRLYPVNDGIPVMLIEESIQIQN